jgi:hypothetical protein
MPIDSKHPLYDATKSKWRKVRVCVEGEDSVKAAREEFLARLTDQSTEDYDAYLRRAVFVPATKRSMSLLVSLLTKKPAVVVVPPALEPMLESFTSFGETLTSFVKVAASEVLATNRYGILVDVDGEMSEGNLPYVSGFCAEAIYNWRTVKSAGRDILVSVVLEESDWQQDPEDSFKSKELKKLRHLYLDENGYYSVDIYTQQEVVRQGQSHSIWIQTGDTIQPKIRGEFIGVIPFIVISQDYVGTDLTPADSLLLDMSSLNISHYNTSADLEHGRHFTALPTAWVAGFDPKTTRLYLGSQTAWVSSEVNAKAGFLEFTGAGLGHLAEALKEKWEQLSLIGSKILESEKAGVESNVTIQARRSGEQGLLSSLAESISTAITFALKFSGAWVGANGEVSCSLDKEFFNSGVATDVINTAMSGVLNGTVSYPTFFTLLQKSSIYPEGWTIDDEVNALMLGIPGQVANAPTDGAGEGEPPVEE